MPSIEGIEEVLGDGCVVLRLDVVHLEGYRAHNLLKSAGMGE